MPETIGPHLLGRIPSPPDERDYRLENFLGLPLLADAIDPAAVTAELRQTTVGYKKWAATAYVDVTETHWWKALSLLGEAPAPPAPPTGDVTWQLPDAVLDQGDFGTCVGNGFSQFLNALPVDDQYSEGMGVPATQGGPYARAVYYEATCLDGGCDDPDAAGGGQQGATVRSGAEVLRKRGRIQTYAFAHDLDTMRAWLHAHGPLVVGTDWTQDMFGPDASGYVLPTGPVEGGHCWVINADLPDESAFGAINSWGAGWGLGGYFKIKWSDFNVLLGQGGEVVAAVELPL